MVKRFIFFAALLLIIIGSAISAGAFGLSWQKNIKAPILPAESVRLAREESAIIDVVKKTSESVVTVGINKTNTRNVIEIDPFNPFGSFGTPRTENQNIEADIGSGFIISKDGLVVTNKHVVSDTSATYRVITSADKTYNVEKIYRDPTNDLAILKINPPAGGLTPIELGDSDQIQVGQMAIAIGTALGEFRSTVTVGVISGIGRGITAGGPFEGYAERLDNVIQTDAAINPGNSGGPLLNSSGQVIGVNTAVVQGSENIGFAIPINIVRSAIENFNSTGQFSRAVLGVRYRMIGKDLALMNNVPSGAYLVEVIDNSSASKAGLEAGDIITKFDGQLLNGEQDDLAKLINQKKIGDTVEVEYYRDNKTHTTKATFTESN
ncbi:trypsin-like peptidase domain-containing protein [Candidatus Gottesmanbacteria bacterium]|nr:trypsin-like peptidase domain-containing protein [Candidatus Gottesmanbacteria bacterium]